VATSKATLKITCAYRTKVYLSEVGSSDSHSVCFYCFQCKSELASTGRSLNIIRSACSFENEFLLLSFVIASNGVEALPYLSELGPPDFWWFPKMEYSLRWS
jgi:hypothetical protein